MPIVLKTVDDISRMRESGNVLADVMQRMRQMIVPDVTTRDLDTIAHAMIRAAGGQPSFLGYHGYPASICASVNEVVLHGIPNDRPLQEGDIVSIDLGVYLNGFHTDAAFTAGVGKISDAARDLIETTEDAFWLGVEALRYAKRLGQVGAVIQEYAESRGYGVIREFAGHGIGRAMHEEPSVPNWGLPESGARLRNGMTIALEPMISIGSPETRTRDDGWTVEMASGALAAHYEHTIAFIDGDPMLLTDGGGLVI